MDPVLSVFDQDAPGVLEGIQDPFYQLVDLCLRCMKHYGPFKIARGRCSGCYGVFASLIVVFLKDLADNVDRDTKVVEFATPDELVELIDFSLPQEGRGLSGLVEDVKSTMKYSVRTGHVRFFNQLFAGNDLAGVMGEWVTALLNTTSYTFELGPVTAIIEKTLVEKMCDMVGFKNGEGVFTPGGSLAILMAMILARNKKIPDCNHNGIMNAGKGLVCFTSIQSHYSINRAASICGIGRNGVVPISCDKEGRMNSTELEEKIKEVVSKGLVPFMINATAGTTVLCSFDNFEEISKIASKYDIWLHIDGCQGASVLFSEQHKHLMNGCHNADSITWNPHKMLGIPLQCSVILTKQKGILLQSNASNADYLFHQHDLMEYDMGDKTIQCGRKTDHLKFWLSWKAHGDLGFRYRINKAIENAQTFSKYIKEREAKKRFKLVQEPYCHSVPFWCVPKTALIHEFLSENWNREVSEKAHIIRKRMRVRGNMMLNYQPLKDQGYPYFFRLTVHNPLVNEKDLLYVLDEFEKIMDELEL